MVIFRELGFMNSHFSMTRRAPVLVGIALLVALCSSAFCFPVLAADKPIAVETYRAQLQKAETQLQKMEARPPRKIAPILNALAKDQIIRRRDGQTQTASGDEFRRLSKQVTAEVTHDQTRRLRARISARKTALDAWSRSTYAPAEAQSIIKQLEGSGQIRTGPSWIEQSWSNFYKWIKQSFQSLLKWLGGLFPSGQGGKLPTIDPNWIRAIFTLTVLALLAAIGFLVWRAVGGKIGKKRNKQGAFAFSPEDAELLSLPPDELRERALRFAGEGNFREALRHLYIALLLNLDARGVWRYDTRRTNWEHIAALRDDALRSTLVAPLADITHRFDRVRYGNAACGPGDWTQFERDVTALEASTSA